MRAIRFIFVVALAAAGSGLPAQAADTAIQPGARARTSVGGCTYNFVYRDLSERLYIGIAAHCVGDAGDRVSGDSGGEFGTVVYRRFSGDDDFALIAIDVHRYADVNPSMRHWGGPTGHTTWEETSQGDAVLYSGYGTGFGSTSVTRPRAGILTGDTSRQYTSQGTVSPGDSGGPVLHAATGKALGFANNIKPLSLANGSTVERFIDKVAEEHGLVIEVVTAAYTRPF